MKNLISVGCIALGMTALWAQQSPKAVRTADEMEPLLATIAKYDSGQSRIPLAQFTQLVQDSLANPEMLKLIEARLLKFIQSDTTKQGQEFGFRELSLIGTDTSVPVLAPMLTQRATAEMSRYAISRIPGPAADGALRNALGQTTGNTRIGLISTIGLRHDSKAVPAIAALAASSDPATAEAAFSALALIGDRPALDALRAARSNDSRSVRQHASEALAQCAGQFAARGDTATASRVYRELISAQEPPMVRVVALGGLASTEGRAAVPALLSEVEGSDAKTQAAAIRLLSGIPGPEITTAMIREFPKVSAPGQVRLLSALADRDDPAAAPLVLKTARDGEGQVRTSALRALGKLGDGSAVTLLATAAANGQGEEQSAARRSLYSLHGDSVDPAVVAALGSTSGKVKAELIVATGERGTAGSAAALVKAIQDQDPDVHREALKALRNVAGPDQVPGLVDFLINASSTQDRRDAAQTLAVALKRSRAAQFDVLLSTYGKTTAVPARLSLLEVMGQTSSDQTLPVLRTSLNDSNPEIARGAVLALTDWSSGAPMPDLLALAKNQPKNGGSPALQVLALRGYLKLVALPSDRPAAESARLLAEVMPLAKQAAEKRSVLALVGNYPCKESLQIAEASTSDDAVANEARAAVDKINGALKFNK
jgi:HEAT repeat protein